MTNNVPNSSSEDISAPTGDASTTSTLTASESTPIIEGTPGNDTLTGGPEGEQLIGHAGADILDGGGGPDVLDGGPGQDTLRGGAGDDKLTGSGGDDLLSGGAGNDEYFYNRGCGHDVIEESAGFDRVVFNFNNTDSTEILLTDLEVIRAGNDLIIGTGGDDRLTIRGWYASPDNKIDEFLFYEPTFGGEPYSANEIASLADLRHVPVVNAPIADQVASEDNAFTFQVPADAFSDADVGDNLTMSASLSDGSILPAWLSFDAATGAFSGTPENGDVGELEVAVTATDSYGLSVSDTFALNVLNINDAPVVGTSLPDQTGVDFVPLSIQLPGDALLDIDAGDVLTYSASLADGSPLPEWLHFDTETLTFTGTPIDADIGTLAIAIEGTDSSGASVSDAFSLIIGENPVVIRGEAGRENKLEGTPGDDILVGRDDKDDVKGEAGDDWLIGNDGDDKLDGKAGDDHLSGGPGNDDLKGGEGNNVLEGGSGDDKLEGEEGDDQLFGGEGNDELKADKGSNFLDGGAGDDKLEAKEGDDELFGGDGNDELKADKGNNFLDGGAGDDKLEAREGDDQLFGGDGNDELKADHGNNVLDGGAGDDKLEAKDGDDRLYGGAGSDALKSGKGEDVLSGGSGNDTLEGGEGDDSYLFGRDFDHDTIVEKKSDPGDEVLFGADITPEQLWFSQSSTDLNIDIVGSGDRLTIEKWFDGPDHRVETFRTDGGAVLLEAQVQQLVNAMAAFDPPSGSDLTLAPEVESALEPVLAVTWQSS